MGAYFWEGLFFLEGGTYYRNLQYDYWQFAKNFLRHVALHLFKKFSFTNKFDLQGILGMALTPV